MYSGTTLTRYSGLILGAHQRIDRSARRHLGRLLPDNRVFPSARRILYFEGKNGPDAIKRKSPAKDEPWHYFNPFDESDSQLLDMINDHYKQLVKELKAGNEERTAFEAAWLAHAIVDGLTPAHHYPYAQELTRLRGGSSIEDRTTIKEKLLIPGSTLSQQIANNWKMWGPRGLFTSHGLFEIGVATIIAPLSLNEAEPTQAEVALMREIGHTEWFLRTAREIAVMEMYETYRRKGWTSKLAWEVRHKLAPTIVKAVTLTWYAALVDAGILKQDENHSRQTRRKDV